MEHVLAVQVYLAPFAVVIVGDAAKTEAHAEAVKAAAVARVGAEETEEPL